MKRIFKQTIGLILVVSMAFSAVGMNFGVLAETDYEIEERLLGSVSAKYESNGDPGTISSGNGDPGGASYGAYQFSGTYKIPISFADWLVSSGRNVSIGERLQQAYYADGNAFSDNFVSTWKAIAAEDSSAFLKLQHDYVKHSYYDPAAESLRNNLGLDVNNYTIALKNAVWSRALQHGVGSYSSNRGAVGLFRKVHEATQGGILSLSEDAIISAVYHEAGLARDYGDTLMHADSAGGNAWIIRDYGLEGLSMKYFEGSSSAVQAGVWLRLNVNELNELLQMYNDFKNEAVSAWTKPAGEEAGVNIYDASGNVIIVVPGDVNLIVTGAETNGRLPITVSYVGVTYDGFCDSNCISYSPPLNLNVAFGQIDNAETTVNIRQFPTTDSVILTSMPVGTKLWITGPVFNGWYPVDLVTKYGRVKGYCYGQYVTVFNDGRFFLLGDIDFGGTVDVQDALKALQCAVGKITLDEISKEVSDVDFNGTVSVSDALMILQLAVGKITGYN